jgi:putative monooxygenase
VTREAVGDEQRAAERARSRSVPLAAVDPVTSRGGEIRVAISPARVGSEHHIFGVARLRPGERIGEHVHDYGEESVFVVSGRGVMSAGGDRHVLEPDTFVFAPRGTVHGIVNTGEEPLVMVFASAPLAPRPALGHREVTGAAGPDPDGKGD